jgi:hypothetical protein
MTNVNNATHVALDTITDIQTDLTWLNLAHTWNPQPDDLAAFGHLAQRLTIALTTLLTDTGPPRSTQAGAPADQANVDFPKPISAALSTPPPEPPPPKAPPDSGPGKRPMSGPAA